MATRAVGPGGVQPAPRPQRWNPATLQGVREVVESVFEVGGAGLREQWDRVKLRYSHDLVVRSRGYLIGAAVLMMAAGLGSWLYIWHYVPMEVGKPGFWGVALVPLVCAVVLGFKIWRIRKMHLIDWTDLEAATKCLATAQQELDGLDSAMDFDTREQARIERDNAGRELDSLVRKFGIGQAQGVTPITMAGWAVGMMFVAGSWLLYVVAGWWMVMEGGLKWQWTVPVGFMGWLVSLMIPLSAAVLLKQSLGEVLRVGKAFADKAFSIFGDAVPNAEQVAEPGQWFRETATNILGPIFIAGSLQMLGGLPFWANLIVGLALALVGWFVSLTPSKNDDRVLVRVGGFGAVVVIAVFLFRVVQVVRWASYSDEHDLVSALWYMDRVRWEWYIRPGMAGLAAFGAIAISILSILGIPRIEKKGEES